MTQIIEERLALNDLFVRYTTALDAGNVETVVDCFTDDAVLESPAIGVRRGRDAIREFAGRITRDGKSERLPPGHYACDAIKHGGVWRFHRRVVCHDHDYVLEGL